MGVEFDVALGVLPGAGDIKIELGLLKTQPGPGGESIPNERVGLESGEELKRFLNVEPQEIGAGAGSEGQREETMSDLQAIADRFEVSSCSAHQSRSRTRRPS